MKTALSIAGSDSCGGAGIQADIKTMTMNGVYAMSAVTALTAQNTSGVSAIFKSPPGFLRQQIDAVFGDIFPDAVKVGMVYSEDLVDVIAERLKFYGAVNVVVDPVMSATSGCGLMENGAALALAEKLLPLASLATPNLPEAEILSGTKIDGRDGMVKAATLIGRKHGCAVLVKGGHLKDGADDLLYSDGQCTWFKGVRINNPNAHGTGCTLSSAIAANLAKGFGLAQSVARAKAYLAGALSAMLDLGRGSGPLEHNFNLSGVYKEEA